MCSWAETKRALLAVFALILLILAVAETQFVGLVLANPFYDGGEVPPDSQTYQPAISMSSPENNTAYAVNHLSLAFNVTAPHSKTAYDTAIYHVFYEADCMRKTIVAFDEGYNLNPYKDQLAFSFEFFSIPEGKHTILVQAIGVGWYVQYGTIPNIPPSLPISTKFYINSSSTISFTIDTIAPLVSVFSVENKTYDKTNVPLNFAVNEIVSQIAYSLDGQENVTISGNTTMLGLSDGSHNLTVYTRDQAGNIGASETITFTVTTLLTEPFPATLTAVAAVSVVAIITGLLIYYRKRNH